MQRTSQRLNVAWQRLLVDLIEDGVADGTMACADPPGSAWRILSLLDGLSLQAVAHRVDIDRNAVTDWSIAMAEAELALPAGSLRDAPTRLPK